MARNNRNSGNAKSRAQYQIHAQLAGPQVVESIDRNIRRLESLIDKAGSADREKREQLKIQMQGINHVLTAQRWKMNKLIPDAQRSTETPAAREASFEDRAWAAHYGMLPDEYLQRKAEGTLPPRAPLPTEDGYEEYEAAIRRGALDEAEKLKRSSKQLRRTH